jgi:DNA-binding transcriptional LysR family regulator
MMDFRKLRHVMEICRLGSFVRAADALGISQPALSRSISKIEEELGMTLFERSGHGTRPTVFAEHIVSRAGRALSDVSTLVEEVHLLAKGSVGRLTIGVGAAARAMFAVPLLVKLVEAFPALRIDFVDGKALTLVDRLLHRELDIVITAFEVAPHGRELALTDLFRDDVCFFARPGHPLLKKRKFPSLEDILDYPLALPGRSFILADRATHLDARKQNNLEAYITHDYGVMRDIVERSNAIGQAPISVYRRAFAERTIVPIPARRLTEYRCVALTHRVSEFSPVVCRAVALAKQAALELPTPSTARRADSAA